MIHRQISKDNSLKLLVILIFGVVFVFEYFTPPEYVFGYLYAGPIILFTGRKMTITMVAIAITLTLLNLLIKNHINYSQDVIANRLIASFALGLTGWLRDRQLRSQATIIRQQEQLRNQEQLTALREDFVSTLTHDLKTPLLGAIETLRSLQRGQFGIINPKQQKVLEMIERSHSSSLHLVQTLLDVYRHDTEGLQLQFCPLDLAVLIGESIADLTEMAARRQVYVVMHWADSDFRSHFWVKGDFFQLQRVLHNLIVNAINHSPRGERVEISLESQGIYQIVKVSDRGPGLPQNIIPHLFERFYQGQGDRLTTGSGLGLYLSRQIIDAHGGTIWAENATPKGAIFGFRLLATPPEN